MFSPCFDHSISHGKRMLPGITTHDRLTNWVTAQSTATAAVDLVMSATGTCDPTGSEGATACSWAVARFIAATRLETP